MFRTLVWVRSSLISLEPAVFVPALFKHTHKVLRRAYKPRAICISAGAAMQELCDRLELPLRLVPCAVQAIDERMIRSLEAGGPPVGYRRRLGELSPGQSALHGDGKKWNGHLLPVLWDWAVDVTANQFTDPGRGVVIGPTMFRLPPDFLSYGPDKYLLHRATATGALRYRPTLDNVAYRDTPTWNDKASRERVADLIMRQLKTDRTLMTPERLATRSSFSYLGF